MFGLGATELFIILVLVLIVFGAGKLPQVGEALGKGLNSFKKGVANEEIERNPNAAGEVDDHSETKS